MEYDPATLETVGETSEFFSSVELDVWGQAFLEALDDLLSPGMAEAIARVDEQAYAELVRRREQMALALARRLVPVYAGSVPKVGDLEAARGEFEQALLDSLSRAYTISAVVQVPATVQAAGEAPGLRLFGSVAASAATLPLQATGAITFMVSAEEPRRAVTLPLESAFEVRYVGGAGPEWLEFVLSGLDLPLPPLHVPVPLRAFPVAPVLIRQTATGTSEPGQDPDPIRNALRWDYTVELLLPGNGAQDELRVELAYDAPADANPARTTHGTTELFEALAAFHRAWLTLAPLLPRIADEDGAGPTSRQVLAAVVAQVASVTDRWGAPNEAPLSAPAADTSELVIRFARAYTESRLEVFARRAGEWPSINDQRPAAAPVALPSGDGYRCSYPFSGGDSLTLRWPSVDFPTRQAAHSTFRLVRNAGLADALVYRTAPVTFATPALPRIEVDHLGPLPSGASLEDALAQVLRPIPRVARVLVSYDYPTDDSASRATEPVLQAGGVPIDAASLAKEITTWHAFTERPTDGALLCLQLESDAVKLNRVEITVPPGWW